MRKLRKLQTRYATIAAPEEIWGLFQKAGVNPVRELIKLATEQDISAETGMKDFKLPAKLRAAIWMELAAYAYPRLRASENINTNNEQITIIFQKPGELPPVPAQVIDLTPEEPEQLDEANPDTTAA